MTHAQRRPKPMTPARMLAQTRRAFPGAKLADDFETVAFLCEMNGLEPATIDCRVTEFRKNPHVLPHCAQEAFNTKVLGLSTE